MSELLILGKDYIDSLYAASLHEVQLHALDSKQERKNRLARNPKTWEATIFISHRLADNLRLGDKEERKTEECWEVGMFSLSKRLGKRAAHWVTSRKT